ncbi:hypothetical protein HGRIS_004253 [Hohenbuehelia grisea]|uniref:Uncharacterized protein n=1 Tax=Hohenbuehelia grisea TaxID=104357 RepID=A0ABR3IP85_9AGAR
MALGNSAKDSHRAVIGRLQEVRRYNIFALLSVCSSLSAQVFADAAQFLITNPLSSPSLQNAPPNSAPPPTSSPKHPHPPRTTIPPPCIDLLCSSDIRSVTQSILLRERTLKPECLYDKLCTHHAQAHTSAHISPSSRRSPLRSLPTPPPNTPRRAHPHHRRAQRRCPQARSHGLSFKLRRRVERGSSDGRLHRSHVVRAQGTVPILASRVELGCAPADAAVDRPLMAEKRDAHACGAELD